MSYIQSHLDWMDNLAKELDDKINKFEQEEIAETPERKDGE